MFSLSVDDFKELERAQKDFLVRELSRGVREECANGGLAVIDGLLEEIRDEFRGDAEAMSFFDDLLRRVSWPKGYIFRGLYPPDPDCPDCHGTGYVTLLVSRKSCKACKKFP
jgi:hypothetical protein